MSSTARVGTIVFVAVLALAAMAWFLTDYRIRLAGYPVAIVFDDAMGLTPGSEIRMAGVPIGVVTDVSLEENQRAVVQAFINRMHRIPVDSRFIIRVGLVIGDRYVDIVPNRYEDQFIAAGAAVEGETPGRIEDLLPDAERLLVNLVDATEALRNLITDDEFDHRMRTALANVERATARLDRAMAIIEGTVAREQVTVEEIIGDVAVASRSLRQMTAQLGEFVARDGMQEDIVETLGTTRRAMESMERVTAGLEDIVTAPGFQEDIRLTVAEARATVEEAREVVDRVGRIVGTRPRIEARIPSIPTRDTGIEALLRPDEGRIRTTISTTIPLWDEGFLSVGIYDLGVQNRLIIQPGTTIGPRTDLRYGIYAGTLGIGVDHAFSGKVFGSADLHNPTNPRLDVVGGYSMGQGLGLLLGVDSLFDENRITLGVRHTR